MTVLEDFLRHTDHLATDGVPTREERAALIGPTIELLIANGCRPQALGRTLGRLAQPTRRKRKTTKETPMADPNYNPGGIVEERAEETAQREQADAARRAAAEVRGIPEMIQRYVTHFDGAWASSQPAAVREHRTRELIRAILAGPERDHVPLLTWLVDRQTRRGSR